MRLSVAWACAWLTLTSLVLMPGCKPGSVPAGGGAARQGSVGDLQFSKVSEGLTYKPLDYIGPDGFTLAGAHGSGEVFFGVETEGGYALFSRDLKGGIRRKVGEFNGIVAGTLSTDNSGHWLFYCRDRELSKYIDDPAVKAPQRVGVLYRLRASGGQEEALFDFRDPTFLPYRKYELVPFCSPSGERVAALTFDFDQSMLAMQCDDWIAYREETYSGGSQVRPEDIPKREEQLREFFKLPQVAEYLRQAGKSASASGKLTDADEQIVSDFKTSLGPPRWALLHWQSGQASLIKITMPEGIETAPLVLQAVGEEVIVLSAQVTEADSTPYSNLYTLNPADGTLTPAGRYTGVPSNLQLAQDESAMLIALTPYLPEEKKFANAPVLRRQPLDGSAPSETALPGKFERNLDFGDTATDAVGQDTTDRDIYHIDLASGTRTLLCRLNTEITGIFYSKAAGLAVFLENGFTFQLPVVADPASDPGWVGPDKFAEADSAAREFLTRLGLQLSTGWQAEWEERSTPGIHEFSAQVTVGEKKAQPILIRINADAGLQVESVWMPGGYPVPVDAALQGGSLDVIECEERAEAALDRVGWLSDSRSKYQPGGSPIYDDPTRSYVIVHRDGYALSISGKEEWVFNAESTIRINKDSGAIVEMNLLQYPELKGASAKVKMDEVVLSIRNKGPQPIPENAPVRFDTENYRLVVTDRGQAYWGPARLELPGAPRLCYEIDGFLQPEDQLIMTTRVDIETGDVLGQVTFLTSNQQRSAGRQ